MLFFAPFSYTHLSDFLFSLLDQGRKGLILPSFLRIFYIRFFSPILPRSVSPVGVHSSAALFVRWPPCPFSPTPLCSQMSHVFSTFLRPFSPGQAVLVDGVPFSNCKHGCFSTPLFHIPVRRFPLLSLDLPSFCDFEGLRFFFLGLNMRRCFCQNLEIKPSSSFPPAQRVSSVSQPIFQSPKALPSLLTLLSMLSRMGPRGISPKCGFPPSFLGCCLAIASVSLNSEPFEFLLSRPVL